MQVEAILKEVPLFKSLSLEHLQKLASDSKLIRVEAGQTVFSEGDNSDSMYVILSGQVKVFKRDTHHNEIILDTPGQGAFFGELALLSNETRSATVTTLAHCDFLIIERPVFLDLISRANISILFSVLETLVTKVRQTSTKYFDDVLAKQSLQHEMELASQRALTQMVAGVAHELNTPLGTANTSASILQRILTSTQFTELHQDSATKADLEDALEAIQLLQRNIVRAHKLVEDFKKVSVSQLTDSIEKLNLPEVIADAVGLHKATMKLARLTVQIIDKLPESDKTWVGYRGYLTQVLLNFLTNAERYAYEPGIGGKIEITLEEEVQDDVPSFILTVKDFGKGIPPENLAQVFDPFFTTGRSKGGTGLGMAIVHNIVTEALHGTIKIESEVQKGTTITVIFPQVISA